MVKKEHELDIAVKAEDKAKITYLAKKAIRYANRLESDRREWIYSRQEQIKCVEEIQEQIKCVEEIKAAIYSAYDNGDAQGVDNLHRQLGKIDAHTKNASVTSCGKSTASGLETADLDLDSEPWGAV